MSNSEFLTQAQESLNNVNNKLKLMRERGWYLLARTSKRHADAIEEQLRLQSTYQKLVNIYSI
jgi:hypothetical protein